MASMGYCRFRNTSIEMRNCLAALDEEETLSTEEAVACESMFKDIAEFLIDNNIVTGDYFDISDNISRFVDKYRQ